jgi:hypothetical protein
MDGKVMYTVLIATLIRCYIVGQNGSKTEKLFNGKDLSHWR